MEILSVNQVGFLNDVRILSRLHLLLLAVNFTDRLKIVC